MSQELQIGLAHQLLMLPSGLKAHEIQCCDQLVMSAAGLGSTNGRMNYIVFLL